jgi:hypothetical protein
MKKLFRNYKLPMLTALGGSLLLLGCTNADYDFDKVDYTLGFGSGELVLPSNNSINITLDDILNLGNSDLISTTASGDYVLGKQPEDVNPINVKIDPLVQTIDESGEQSFTIDLPAEIQALAGTTVSTMDKLGHTLDGSGNISLISYKFDVDPVVKELKYVGIGYDNGVDLKLNIQLPAAVKQAKLTIQLPRNFDMTYVGTAGTFNTADNTLTLDVNQNSNASNIQLPFKVKGIYMKKYDEMNYATYDANKNEVILLSDIALQIEIAQLHVPSTPSIELKGTPSFDAIVVTSARGVFDPAIDLDNIGTATINDIPNFLTDKEVVADIANPLIWLTLKSNLPLGGVIEAKISSTTYPQGIMIDGANAIELKPNASGADYAETKVVLCRRAPENLNGYKAIEIEDLSKLIQKLQDGMKLSFTATKAKAKQEEATVELGKKYELTPSYNFNAAMSLGEKAVIVYADKENDWNKDIDKLELSNNSTITLTAAVENQIPADLEINISPLDKSGNVLTALTVTPIKNKVAAGTSTGEIQYDITDASGKALKQLDGVNYRLKVTAPSDAAQKGKTLNKNHKINIKDIKVQVKGKVVYDAN